MKLSEILTHTGSRLLRGNTNVDIQNITANSQNVHAGTLFVAIRGTKTDGHRFLSEVAQMGAVALAVEDESQVPVHFTGAVVNAEESREFLSTALHFFWHEPSRHMTLIGVTGTNGKTTCAYLIEHILGQHQSPVAVMGTIDHHFKNQSFPSDMTTPNPELLFQRLDEFRRAGAGSVVMEVSSHSIDQRRIAGLHFDVSLFTNLTRDHLDYHKDMPNYFQTKQKLFDDVMWRSLKSDRCCVVNVDDEYGRSLRVATGVRVIRYGQKTEGLEFNVLSQNFWGTEIEVRWQNHRYQVQSPLIGIHNAYNAVGAIGVALALNIDLQSIAKSIATFGGTKGRLERVKNSKDISVFVDYAHTDDALKNVLGSLNEIRCSSPVPVKIICVFGCGGDRDKGKRPLMAQACEVFADDVIVTSDNPRSEDPQKIIDEVLKGFRREFLAEHVLREADRRKAILLALQMAKKGDVVLIAGKGHEEYQIEGRERRAFSDVTVVQEFFK